MHGSQGEEWEQSHQTGLCSSSSGGMGQVKHALQSGPGALFSVSSWHLEVCCISRRLSDTATYRNIHKSGYNEPSNYDKQEAFSEMMDKKDDSAHFVTRPFVLQGVLVPSEQRCGSCFLERLHSTS